MNEERDEVQWTDGEAEDLKRLARSEELPADLEDRIVARLSSEGLLGRRVLPWWRQLWMPWALAGTAALAAVFLLGFSLGQRAGADSAASMMAEVRQTRDLEQAIANVQRTGSAYVTALSALGHLSAAQSTDPAERRQSQEVALSALYAAAQELVRLDSDDPVAARLLQGLEAERLRQVSAQDSQQEPKPRKIFWN
ncbi:MAG TPA: hypothetical protein VLV83_26040 [Acidobacteriota bacterium]|nr:hypothetical protein [Acidobacteriota bacterium]